MNTIKFKISELVRLRDNILKREQELANSVIKLEESKKNINKILKNSNDNLDSTVFLDISFLEDIKLNSMTISAGFNWKKVAVEILTKSAYELPTKSIYDFAKLIYPVELADEKKSIHGFSSALSNLLKNKEIIQSKSGSKFYYSMRKINK